MTKQDIVRLIITIVVSVATSIGSFFGISVMTSCETLESVSVGATVTFPPQRTTEFEENITNPPSDVVTESF